MPTSIHCTQCGSNIDIRKQKGEVVCAYCGSIYQVPETPEKPSTDTPKKTQQNLQDLAIRNEKSANYYEALDLYNTILRDDVDNWIAWAGKGRCAGLLSSLGRPRIKEMTDALRYATDHAPKNKGKSIEKELGLFLVGVCAGFMEVAYKGPDFSVYSLVGPERFHVLSPHLKQIRKMSKSLYREFMLAEHYTIYQKSLIDVLVALMDAYGYLDKNMDIIDTIILICHRELRFSENETVSKKAEEIFKKCVTIRRKKNPLYRSPRAKEEFRYTVGCVVFLALSVISVLVWFVFQN